MSTFSPTNLQQEREWIAGLRAGDLEVFRRVFDTYQPLLQHFACIWVPEATADDIVQDVMFDVWERRDHLDAQVGNLTGYLLTAVRHRITDLRRHQRVVANVENEHPTQHPPGMGSYPSATDAEVLRNDLYAALNLALSKLPDIQRAVLMFRWSHEMSYAEIGQALSISPNAAMLHASRARKALSPFLSQLFGKEKE